MFAPTSPIFFICLSFPYFSPTWPILFAPFQSNLFIFYPLFAHMAYCLPHSSSTFRSWMRARIWLRAAFVPKLRLGRVAICKLEPALNVILAKSHKGVPAKPLPMCNMCYIKIYHKNNFITLYTGWFFNGYPLKMSLGVICYCWGNSSMVEGRFSKWF